MKIRETSAARLVLREEPLSKAVLVGLLLLADAIFLLSFGQGGGSLALVGWVVLVLILGFAAVELRRARLWLDRDSGQGELRIRALIGSRQEGFALASIRRAEVEERRDTGSDPDRSGAGSSTIRRPILRMTDRPDLPLRAAWTSGDGGAHLVKAINRWLDQARIETRNPAPDQAPPGPPPR
ncbi:hypothetical protein [Xinfangfangia pollutisoli]|uniref:hypothetical protein n=1 Tax=Xinfangfangia pollutisoli TaxID=2865960 RepID=UPI001CD590A8|nr:hypothetical protein [Xinfangfangia pollutisoli]